MHSISFSVFVLFLASSVMRGAVIDTLRADNGTPTRTNTVRTAWEESVILRPQAPCKVLKALVYYGAGSGTDTLRITGDAAEGSIPPTQYCFAYNTLAKVLLPVAAVGWHEVDLTPYDIRLGGNDGVVVQHLMRVGGPVWSQDASQAAQTSFVYDPITPNPNFYNIPGIFYIAGGDYLVRLVVAYEDTVQPPPQWLDVTTSLGLVDVQGAMYRGDLASVADIDADGYDDVVIGSNVFKNNGGQDFERKTTPIAAGGTVWADVDNDGDVDCFGLNGSGNDKLYRNDGNWTFVDITATSGIVNDAPTVTPLFLDYDHDGDMDLFIANGRREVSGVETYFQDKLFKNNGNSTFTDVTVASKIALGEPAPFYDTWGASLTDYNSDGWTDIFVATYRLAPDRLYRNNKDGTFTEVSAATGAIGIPTSEPTYFGHGMGSDWADIDNDGDVDLAVGNLGHPDQRGQYSNPSLILQNTGTSAAPQFTNWYSVNQSGALDWHGVTFREMNAGMCFGDFDHDGLTDLWHGQISYEQFGAGQNRPSHFYLREDRFVDKSWQTGMFIHGAWTACRFDFDRDGDQDLLVASGTHHVVLYRNDLVKKGHSITLQLDEASGRVAVDAAGSNCYRWLPGTVIGGRCSQMTSDLHVGIGNATTTTITTHWADGTSTTFNDLPADGQYLLKKDGNVTGITIGSPQLRTPQNFETSVAVRPTLTWVGAGPFSEIQISDKPNFANIINQQVEVLGNSFTLVQDLVNGSTYYWRARFERGPAVSPWSSVWSFTVGSPRPSTPRILSPADGSDGQSIQLALKWSRGSFATPTHDQILYDVRCTDVSGDNAVCEHVGLTDTTAECTLQPLTEYRVAVRGRTISATGDWSDTVAFTTYGTPGPITLDTPADGSTSVQIRPRLTWHKHAWVDAGYDVAYDTLADFSTAVVRERSDSVLVVIAALKQQTTYHWRVRGKNLVGEGAWGDTWRFTTQNTTGVETDFESDTWSTAVVYDLLGREIARIPSTRRDLHSIPITFAVIVFFDSESRPIGRQILNPTAR